VERLDALIGLLQAGKDLRAARVVGPPRFRHADLARRSIEQAHTELVFQRPDLGGDRCRRFVERSGRGAEMAAIRDFHEGRHASEAIHELCLSQDWRPRRNRDLRHRSDAFFTFDARPGAAPDNS